MSDIENHISEENKEPENTCEACGEDHEITECDFGFCGHCYEVLDNCDCESPHEISAEEWLREKHRIDDGYRADMEALKAESEALRQAHAEQELAYDHAEMMLEKGNAPTEAYPFKDYPFKSDLDLHNADMAAIKAALETVDVQVELLAFPYEVKERTVRVPKPEWDKATDKEKLDLVFYYGQNDFQPSRTCYSVSVNDVIRMPDGKRYRVAGMGFEELKKPSFCISCDLGIPRFWSKLENKVFHNGGSVCHTPEDFVFVTPFGPFKTPCTPDKPCTSDVPCLQHVDVVSDRELNKPEAVAAMNGEVPEQMDMAGPEHDKCSKCGGEKDSEGWCAKYCMDEQAWGQEHLTGWKK